MTQDYRVSLTLSRRRSKSRNFSVDELHTCYDANLFMFQYVGLLMYALKAYTDTAISIVQVIGNISNVLRSHASRRIYSSNKTLPIRPNWWKLRTSSRQVTIQIFAAACYFAFQERDRRGMRKAETLISHAEGRQNAEYSPQNAESICQNISNDQKAPTRM